ncbi:MAG: NAD(P)/FAD-dependent oxidoreductase [Halobacteriales archaeon]|nr:NAD(P)/FAD-dependent oxidoreductase [Halobacteriales archaeon]
MERVDVAVVGGGPAGSSAAKAAADRGASVVLFEKGVPRADRDELGPDSTDAAGMLDYWVDLMDMRPDEIPEEIIHRQLDGATFYGPSEAVTLDSTGIPSSYPRFGFTFDRARFDDWLGERARAAGAEYRIGNSVTAVETTVDGDPRHELSISDGSTVGADYLVLADGPQRTVTMGVLNQFMPAGESMEDYLASTSANHIAYQEYRRFPEEVFEPSILKFWWGYIPGETAYPWVFPNEETVARVGLTMPIGLDLEEVTDREGYRLLRSDDDRVPSGEEYIRRLLEAEYGDSYDIEADFPRVENRGKRNGTETYPISSTQPIDSPTRAGIAVTGGAMGATSAFHEGGGHVAVRTGKIAGRLAAEDRLDRYNDTWKAAIGDELRRNISMADMVEEYTPDDWDRAFRITNRILSTGNGSLSAFNRPLAVGIDGLRIFLGYRWRKFQFRDGRYVQFPERRYTV